MKRVAFFLSALSLTASLAFSGVAQAAPSSTHRIAETTIPHIRVWVTLYKGGFANIRSIAARGWMSLGSPFYIDFGMANSDTYLVRAEVYADATMSRVIADTTATLDNRTGVAIKLRKNAHGYYWQF